MTPEGTRMSTPDTPMRHQLNSTAPTRNRRVSVGVTLLRPRSSIPRPTSSLSELSAATTTRPRSHHGRWLCDRSGPSPDNRRALLRVPQASVASAPWQPSVAFAEKCAAQELSHVEEQEAEMASLIDEHTRRRIEMHVRALSLRPPLAEATGHRVRRDAMCAVCESGKRVYRFEPCGHLCACSKCVDMIRKEARPQCPLCRWYSDRIVKAEGRNFSLEEMGLDYKSSPHAETRQRLYRMPLPDEKADDVRRAHIISAREITKKLSSESMWRGPGQTAVFEISNYQGDVQTLPLHPRHHILVPSHYTLCTGS